MNLQCLNLCGEKSHMVSIADKICKTLEDSCKFHAVYQGHYHEGDYRIINGIEYITLKAMCEREEKSFLLIETDNKNVSNFK